MSSDFADLHAVADDGGKKKSSAWPKLPGHDAGLVDIQQYLTTAARLPAGWVVEKVKRHGQHADNPLTLTIRRPGDEADIEVQFEAQRDCSKPGALRGAFAEATKGMSRMKYPSPAQASDYYVMVCALAEVGEVSTREDETDAWLNEYLERGWLLPDMTLVPDARYDALCALQARKEFDRLQADRYVRNELDEQDRWAVIVDTQTGELWIRAGEFATYMRKVYGIQVSQRELDSRVEEYGGKRRSLEEDLRKRGGRHITLVFYVFPSAQAFPSVIRM